MELLEEEGRNSIGAGGLSPCPEVPHRIGEQVLASKDRITFLSYEFVSSCRN